MSRRDRGALVAAPWPLLLAAEALYGAATRAWRAAWDAGRIRPARLPVPVVSVGNLVVGGTGKTPAVLGLATAARDLGFRPAILTRGYGRRGPEAALLGGRVALRPAHPDAVGDEPLLLSRTLPDVPVLVGADRAGMAERALEAGTPIDLFLLDDGFQHRALARDADLVLLDAHAPLGNGHLLPAGPLREPPDALRRATCFLLTATAAPGPRAAEALLERVAPGRPQVGATVRVVGLASLGGGERGPALRGLRVHAVAAIARPERFRALLEAEGAEVAGWSARRDHHRVTADDVRAEEMRAAALGARPVTTAKDAVRIEAAGAGEAWLRLEVALEPEAGWEALLRRVMKGDGGP